MSSPQTKKILIGVIVLLILAGGAYFYFSGSASVPVDILLPTENGVVGQDILILIDKLKAVSIDQSLFSSAMFASLQDASVPLVPEPVGRVNPFAIIGVER